MLQQDLCTQQDQDHAAKDLGFLFKLAAKNIADLDTAGRKDACAQADHQHRREDAIDAADGKLRHGKGDAYSQRVDGGCHRHNKHGLDRQVCIMAVLALALGKGFLEHIDANDTQQNEGHPMVNRLDRVSKQVTKEIADQGHQRLKAAEPDSASQSRLHCRLLHGKALADGHRESIHAHAHRQKHQFSKSHKK